LWWWTAVKTSGSGSIIQGFKKQKTTSLSNKPPCLAELKATLKIMCKEEMSCWVKKEPQHC